MALTNFSWFFQSSAFIPINHGLYLSHSLSVRKTRFVWYKPYQGWSKQFDTYTDALSVATLTYSGGAPEYWSSLVEGLKNDCLYTPKDICNLFGYIRRPELLNQRVYEIYETYPISQVTSLPETLQPHFLELPNLTDVNWKDKLEALYKDPNNIALARPLSEVSLSSLIVSPTKQRLSWKLRDGVVTRLDPNKEEPPEVVKKIPAATDYPWVPVGGTSYYYTVVSSSPNITTSTDEE